MASPTQNTSTNTNTFNVVSINMGGMETNPFEYFTGTGEKNKHEWDWKTHLSGLKVSTLISYLSNFPTKYSVFTEFVKSLDSNYDDVFDYIFEKVDYDKLELDNKFGRKDSSIKRFNPIEFGYSPLYFMTDKKNQFEHAKEIGRKLLSEDNLEEKTKIISNTLEKCLNVPFMNDNFSLEHSNWLSKDYKISSIHNIILYDMMKTYSILTNFGVFDTIYSPCEKDIRIDRLLGALGNTPSIIFTQEGGINDTRVHLEAEVILEGGVKMYSFNMDINIYRFNNITENIAFEIGNKKSLDVEFFYKKKHYRIVGVHAKEPKNERTYENFVNKGITGIIKKDYGNGWVEYIMDWLYGVNETKTIVIGDFNTKNNDKTDIVRKEIGTKYNMYPTQNIITTSKTRSGYCAQPKKFWCESKVCKDIAITNTDIQINSCSVFPAVGELLTDKWNGDHSALIVNISE